jgi:hypothetical protein
MGVQFSPAWEFYQADEEILEAMEGPRHGVRDRGERFAPDAGITRRPLPGRSGRRGVYDSTHPGPEVLAAFCAAYLRGDLIRDLVTVFGVCDWTLRRWRRELGLKKRGKGRWGGRERGLGLSRGWCVWTPARLALVRWCHGAGMSSSEGAALLGVPAQTFRQARLKAGVRVKKPQPSYSHLPTHLRPDAKGVSHA